MKRGVDIFQTVKIEGAILPADLLRRLADGDRDIVGLRSEDYHLAKSERINEASTRAWNRLQGLWQGFKNAIDTLSESDIGTSLTRERWLLIIFQELGYGRLTTCKAYEIDCKTYPISHEWQNTPIHLVSFRQDLDKRTPGRAGAARINPHGLVQEFLNRSDDHLWGFVSNGLNLRLLRDNVSLTRQAYIEFDLQAMMDSDAYSDFFLLYLLCHQSRVEVPEGKSPAHCWLEKWYNMAAQQGVRALDQLRDGVQTAIESMGGGFLAYHGNTAIREKLRSGELSTQDYYRQVLRQIYRLLFLFVAEDRDLLLNPESPPDARRLYLDHYSTRRLRTLAERTRGTRHPDLWRAMRLVLDRLYNGCPHLALPALGSFLFSRDATPDLNDLEIANKDLLKAIYALALTVDRNVLRSVNYRNLGPEELGSVYESLLEMHPIIYMEATNPKDRFRLTVVAGSERKTTGSYYTPTSLVNCLLDSALDPVLDEACKKPDPEKAVLALKVCDPACGSGHFLIAAAHRIAERLAAIQAGEDEPSPKHYQHALRDVISRCIYGVDVNPMSVELCKVSLWMEAMEPGKPLTFLDHHIKCGNSLLGTTPALLKRGIPDDAFKPIEGDDKEFCKKWKKENKKERAGFVDLIDAHRDPWERIGNLGAAMLEIDTVDDSSIQGLHNKEQAYTDFVRSSGYLAGKFLYDAWCAAFVWRKREMAQLPYPITQDVIFRIEENPYNCPTWMRDEIFRIAKEYRFFHWHLEFPDVFKPKPESEITEDDVIGWSGGFDCVIGNPPWERIKLQEIEFFTSLDPEIANASTAAARRRLIAKLPVTNPTLHHSFREALRRADGDSKLVHDTGRYPLCGRGDVNTYSIFAELKRSLLNLTGRVGCIVPSGIATDDTTKYFFQDLLKRNSLISLYSFENEEFIFPAIHHATKFCLLSMATPGSDTGRVVDFVFFARQTEHLAEKERHFTLSSEDIALINPNTRTCPIFRSKRDAEITKYIYRRVPVLIKEGEPDGNPWSVRFKTMFHMTNDSHLFYTREQLEQAGGRLDGNIFRKDEDTYLPLYEAKMIWIHDPRFGTYEGQTEAQANQGKLPELGDAAHESAEAFVFPRYWIVEDGASDYLNDHVAFLAFRDITSAVVSRTSIFCVIPPVPCGNSLPLALIEDRSHRSLALIGSCCSSFAFDSVARQSLGGSHMNFFVLKQLPILSPTCFKEQCSWDDRQLGTWAFGRALELYYTGFDLERYGEACGYNGPPFKWIWERRFLLQCELDAAFFHLYLGTEKEWREKGSSELLEYFPSPRDAVEYIMDTFTIVKRRDEQKHGSYRTKDTILEIYNEMDEIMQQNAAAADTGRQPTAHYQSRLNPLPGPPCDAEGNFIPISLWDRTNWPPHIHLPREDAITRPEEVPLEEFVAMAYPATETDKAICAAAIAIVEQYDVLSSMDHLDALLLVTHPEWCGTFLNPEEQPAFNKAINSAPGALFVTEAEAIRWKECRDYLEKLQAISVRHGDRNQAISLGVGIAIAKDGLPSGVDAVVGFAIKAMRRLAELRKDLSTVPQDKQKIIRMCQEHHRLYQLSA